MEFKACPQKSDELEEQVSFLPSLDSPLLPSPEDDTSSCKSTSKILLKRKMYKAGKVMSMPLRTNLVTRISQKKYRIEADYNILTSIGSGSYGTVMLATPAENLSQRVAVKVAKGDTSIKLLKHEAEMLKTLDHESIPKFIDFKIDAFSNVAYLIMEYIEGQTLDVFLENE